MCCRAGLKRVSPNLETAIQAQKAQPSVDTLAELEQVRRAEC